MKEEKKKKVTIENAPKTSNVHSLRRRIKKKRYLKARNQFEDLKKE